MFNGYGVLELGSDYLDLSYRRPEEWPLMTPQGSIKSFTFEMGDPESGPVFQLGLISPLESEPLDWPNSIDPPHFHGTDQFRVISGGEWSLANKTMGAGSFAFQESGLRYSEHPGKGGAAWVMLVLGDRRGARPTLVREAHKETLINTGSGNDRPLADDEVYPHPAGPRGIAAIATSEGPCERGYRLGSFAALARGVQDHKPALVSGVLGDRDRGPVALVVKAAPGCRVSAASTCGSERFLVVSGGSCRIGDREYVAGDMRIQGAYREMPEIVSGADGLEATWIIADRRARIDMADEIGAFPWHREAPSLHA
ncbi:MAG: hypothetical protein WC247_06085 [Porticoccaceae bacterium]